MVQIGSQMEAWREWKQILTREWPKTPQMTRF